MENLEKIKIMQRLYSCIEELKNREVYSKLISNRVYKMYARIWKLSEEILMQGNILQLKENICMQWVKNEKGWEFINMQGKINGKEFDINWEYIGDGVIEYEENNMQGDNIEYWEGLRDALEQDKDWGVEEMEEEDIKEMGNYRLFEIELFELLFLHGKYIANA